MNLATWLPNKTLLWKEWRQNWVPAAILLLVIAYNSSYTLLKEIANFKFGVMKGYEYTLYLTRDLLSFNSEEFGLISVLLAVGLGALAIGRDREEGTFNLMLSMPYSRRTIIYHKFVVTAGAIIAAYTVNALLMSVLLWSNPEVAFPFNTGDVWLWAGFSVLVQVFSLAFAFVISTLSGTTLGNWILSVIFLFFPMGFAGLIHLNLTRFVGYSWYSNGVTTDIYGIGVLLTVPSYIMGNGYIPDFLYPYPWLYISLLLVPATVALYQITQYLFARNPMENNGGVLMFNSLELVLKLGVAVCFALLLVPVLIHNAVPHPIGLIVSYFAVAAVFWALVTWIIRWRRRT